MRITIYKRVLEETNYILDNKSTIRQTSKITNVSKSTVHKDLTQRLSEINPYLSKKVKEQLDLNYEERAYRGGEATKTKYKKMKS